MVYRKFVKNAHYLLYLMVKYLIIKNFIVVVAIRYVMSGRETFKEWIIVVVDDHRDNREALSQILKLNGITVYPAESGAEALGILETVTPTVMLLDIRMADMDGWELLNIIRSNPQTSSLLVVAFTSSDPPAELTGTGFDAYYQKPMQVRVLLQNLVELVHKTE
jgi:CheY-like chemotaxis protein